MPHSLNKMRAVNTLIAHSLSPLVCLIYFCLYIVITKEVHPYAEESVLYLYNSSSSIVDATINAKDFSYYALPIHLLFRIGSLFGSDLLYCARLASIAFVIYDGPSLPNQTCGSCFARSISFSDILFCLQGASSTLRTLGSIHLD